MTEIRFALEEVFGYQNAGRKASPTPLPKRVVVFTLDTSVTDLLGESPHDPNLIKLEAALTVFRPSNTAQATDLLGAANAAQHHRRLRDYLSDHVEAGCSPTKGADGKDATCTGISRIGIAPLDGYESVFDPEKQVFLSCADDDSGATAFLDRALAKTSLRPETRSDLMTKKRQCAAMKQLRSYATSRPDALAKLGLGRFHPQCYVEATRTAETNYKIDDDMAICLRHAARWAVALRMTELCLDDRFKDVDTSSGAADEGRNLLGISCGLPLEALPPLPEECAYSEIVNKRPWLDRRKQNALCPCKDPYLCAPTDWFQDKPIGKPDKSLGANSRDWRRTSRVGR